METINLTDLEKFPLGTLVRSFDFKERRDWYVEGRVVGYADIDGCPRYAIMVEARVKHGDRKATEPGQIVYPPVNGVPIWGDETNRTNGVERVGE